MSQMPVLSVFCALIFHLFSATANDISLETYIVHVDHLPHSQILSDQSQDYLETWYNSFLPTTLASETDQTPPRVYSYRNVFSGFAAEMAPDEAKAMEKKAGFISARPQEIFSLQTTHSPNFLGLHQNTGFWNNSNYGRGVIIGVLDGGIIPDHPSFGDKGSRPFLRNGKGCVNSTSPVHATTSSLEQGTSVSATGLPSIPMAMGPTRPAPPPAISLEAPLAHIAAYKVCSSGCLESDILPAMDIAIEDGVDVVSISLVGPSRLFHNDNIAVGAFAATERGILVSISPGNRGPASAMLSNEAPWILIVGSSTMDRKLPR